MGKLRSRFVRAAIVGVVFGVAALLVVLPSASATPKSPSQRAALDLSSVPKIEAYIRSLGVDPGTVVIQRGARNYAGPNCPGAGWTCTDSTRVVQVSSSTTAGGGNQNSFVCKKDKGTGTVSSHQSQPQKCLIVQGTGTNSATCSIQAFGGTGVIDQTCFITQAGASNTANASLVAGMASGQGNQTVNQRIEIRQTGASSQNALNASETAGLGVGMKANGGNVSAAQAFNQVFCGNQIATGSGSNTASVSQFGANAAAYANTGSVTLSQNGAGLASTCTDGSGGQGGAAPFADINGQNNDQTLCPLETGGSSGTAKTDANSCSRVQQQSDSGKNSITKQQQTNLSAAAVDTASGDVAIDQGSPLGGIDSTHDQLSSGLSTIADTQSSTQLTTLKHVSGSLNVQQTEDPRCCAGGHQIGNAGNSWTLGQTLTQQTFVDGVLVDPDTTEGGVQQSGADVASCTSTGNCSVQQTATSNTESNTNSCSGSTCDIETPSVTPPDSLAECIGDNPDRSVEGVTPSDMTVTNESGGHVRIFWLDYQGNLVFYNDLNDGQSYLQQTWLTHPWVALADDGSCVSYFLVDEPTESWVIGGIE